jgi:hypothetical protein
MPSFVVPSSPPISSRSSPGSIIDNPHQQPLSKRLFNQKQSASHDSRRSDSRADYFSPKDAPSDKRHKLDLLQRHRQAEPRPNIDINLKKATATFYQPPRQSFRLLAASLSNSSSAIGTVGARISSNRDSSPSSRCVPPLGTGSDSARFSTVKTNLDSKRRRDRRSSSSSSSVSSSSEQSSSTRRDRSSTKESTPVTTPQPEPTSPSQKRQQLHDPVLSVENSTTVPAEKRRRVWTAWTERKVFSDDDSSSSDSDREDDFDFSQHFWIRRRIDTERGGLANDEVIFASQNNGDNTDDDIIGGTEHNSKSNLAVGALASSLTAMNTRAAPIDISAPNRHPSASPAGSNNVPSNLTSALRNAQAFDPQQHALMGYARSIGMGGLDGVSQSGGRKDSFGAAMAGAGTYWEGGRTIPQGNSHRDKPRRESVASSGMGGGMSWGGISVGSWIRDEYVFIYVFFGGTTC